MPFIKLQFPPGTVRQGTVYDAMGRWYDSNVVRWHDGPADKPILQPEGGWLALTGAGSSAVGGIVRGMHAWRRSGGIVFVALGTRLKLWVYSAGTLSDVTPAGFTSGATDASGTYYARVEAHTWSMDTFGEDLVACSTTDGRILLWDSSVGVGTISAPLTNAPTNCEAVVVTPENFIFALGASGDGRLIKWADQGSGTVWTAATNNQAGGYTLPGSGVIMGGKRGHDETLIWTDKGLFRARYVGGSFVYSITNVADNCGAISRKAMAIAGDGRAFWMGQRGFYQYDGFVRPLPCDWGDYIFSSLKRAQASKIACWTRSDFNEVIWTYPDAGSTEVNHRIVYNYLLGWWAHSTYVRSDGIDRGFLEYPLESGSNGCIYEHEQGTLYADEGGSPSYTPYAESGPIELGEGDNVFTVLQAIPDENSLATATLTLYTAFYPNGTETTSSAFTLANPTDIRLTGRQVRVRASQVTGGWRWGSPRLLVKPGGLR